MIKHYILILFVLAFSNLVQAQSWRADNGNGTFTNPLFYEEYSDYPLETIDMLDSIH